jgi:hypothetical protein
MLLALAIWQAWLATIDETLTLPVPLPLQASFKPRSTNSLRDASQNLTLLSGRRMQNSLGIHIIGWS